MRKLLQAAQVTEQGLLACLGNAPEPITLWKITETTSNTKSTLHKM